MLKHHNKKIENILTAPTIRLEEGQEAEEILLNFFKDLGWNPKLNGLKPSKIRTSKMVFDTLLIAICEKSAHPANVGAFMVDKGPSVDDDIPINTVYLLEGWLLPLDEGDN